jgi:hypothetical protein
VERPLLDILSTLESVQLTVIGKYIVAPDAADQHAQTARLLQELLPLKFDKPSSSILQEIGQWATSPNGDHLDASLVARWLIKWMTTYQYGAAAKVPMDTLLSLTGERWAHAEQLLTEQVPSLSSVLTAQIARSAVTSGTPLATAAALRSLTSHVRASSLSCPRDGDNVEGVQEAIVLALRVASAERSNGMDTSSAALDRVVSAVIHLPCCKISAYDSGGTSGFSLPSQLPAALSNCNDWAGTVERDKTQLISNAERGASDMIRRVVVPQRLLYFTANQVKQNMHHVCEACAGRSQVRAGQGCRNSDFPGVTKSYM